jgi:hypothetical protein
MYTYCMNCGARNDRTAASCVNCGAVLEPTEAPTDSTATEGSGTAPTPPSPPDSSGETYSPPDTSQSGAEGSSDYGASAPPQDPSSQSTAEGPGGQQPDGGFGSSTPPPATPYGSEGGASRSDERREEYAPSSGAYGSPGSTGGASHAGPASGGGVGTQVPNRLVPAIAFTIIALFLLLPSFFITGLGIITGIIAIVFAAQVNGKSAAGDISGAQQASRTARILNYVTLAIVGVGLLVTFVWVGLIVASRVL